MKNTAGHFGWLRRLSSKVKLNAGMRWYTFWFIKPGACRSYFRTPESRVSPVIFIKTSAAEKPLRPISPPGRGVHGRPSAYRPRPKRLPHQKQPVYPPFFEIFSVPWQHTCKVAPVTGDLASCMTCTNFRRKAEFCLNWSELKMHAVNLNGDICSATVWCPFSMDRLKPALR